MRLLPEETMSANASLKSDSIHYFQWGHNCDGHRAWLKCANSLGAIIWNGPVSPFRVGVVCVCCIHPRHTQLEMYRLPVRECQCETGVIGGLMSVGSQNERVYLSWKNGSCLHWEKEHHDWMSLAMIKSTMQPFCWVLHTRLGLAVVMEIK